MLKYVAAGSAVAGGPVGIALAAGAAALQAYTAYKSYRDNRAAEEPPPPPTLPPIALTDGRGEQLEFTLRKLEEERARLNEQVAAILADERQKFAVDQARANTAIDTIPAVLAKLDKLEAGQSELQAKLDASEIQRRASEEARANADKSKRRWKIGSLTLGVPASAYYAFTVGKLFGWL